MEISGTVAALKADWLSASTTIGTSVNATGDTLTCYDPTWYQCTPPTVHYYQYPWIYPVHVSSPSRPIKLTLREVERLRDAAQRDGTLRAILEKFTPQIEVSVSFE